MDSIFYRYRNITVLLGAIFAQLVLLAWQVKSDKDVPLVRVWAITAVTPAASAIEAARNGTTGFFSNYFALRDAREQSRRLHTEVDRLKLENQFLKNELASAQRAEALVGFQARTPSRMLGARVIGATTGMGAKSVLIDRGTAAGVHKGMAVVTPDGIVGRVLAVYPFASQVLAITDPGFAAGVESQKNHVHGVLKGLGNGTTKVDYVPAGQKIEVGELIFTSGEDRVFPRGMPVGKVTGVKEGGSFQEIYVQPAVAEAAPEEVLVIIDPVHQDVPDAPPAESPVFLAPDVKPESPVTSAPENPASGTPAAKLMDQYRKVGEAQNHKFGEGQPGSLPPNFNLKVPQPGRAATPPAGAPAVNGPATAPLQTPTTTAPVTPVAKPPVAGAARGPVATNPPANSPANSVAKPPVPVKPKPVPPTDLP